MLTDRQQQLLQAIDDAFRGVELGDGVSLHETVVIDNHGDHEARQSARAPDEKHDWRKLIDDPDLARICWVGGLSFYDAEGLRFHLPAYLSRAVKDPDGDEDILESLLFQLTHINDYALERFAILDAPQKKCIRDFLIYVREVWESEEAARDQAIDGYWNSGPTSGKHD